MNPVHGAVCSRSLYQIPAPICKIPIITDWYSIILMRTLLICSLVAASVVTAAAVRLSNDFSGGGYTSVYTLATGTAYTDAVLNECSIARGRQNEPSVAMNPRNPQVLVGSSNDYCGTYAGSPAGTFVAAGPIWIGYYRSENGETIVRKLPGSRVSRRYLALRAISRDPDRVLRRPGRHLGQSRAAFYGFGKQRGSFRLQERLGRRVGCHL